MGMRNAGSLLTLALLAGAACLLLPFPGQESFVAPRQVGFSQTAGSAAASLAEGQTRMPHVSAAAGPTGPPGDNGQPGKINLLFLGLLTGTAVIGLIALFAYGAYSGSGSSL